MKTLLYNQGLSATEGVMLMFPNGCRNASGTDRDVWLGDFLLEELRLTVTSGTVQVIVDIMDGIVLSTDQVLRGGAGASPQRLRGTVATSPLGSFISPNLIDPVWTHTVLADVNASFGTGAVSLPTLRTRRLTFNPVAGVMMTRQFGEGLALSSGGAIGFRTNSTTSNLIMEADFVPWTSGAARKRLATTPNRYAVL